MKKALAILMILALLSIPAAAHAETWTCLACGGESDGDFCPYCGGAKPPEQITCPSCGETYLADLGYVFCKKCGAVLESLDLSSVKAGDSITFGHYEQDHDESNGPEEIEWVVLDVCDGLAMLISRYVLDAQPYNAELADVTWETCTLRAWLNDGFLNAAFDPGERASLVPMSVMPDDHSAEITDTNADVQDDVCLLSADEVDRFYGSDEERKCWPTSEAIKKGAYGNSCSDGACWWWLRSQGRNPKQARVVDTYGRFDQKDTCSWEVNEYSFGVRPVISLRID